MGPSARSSLPTVLRAMFFAFVGAVFLAHWVITDPGYGESATQSEWRYVLFFSAALLTLGVAWPLFGRMVGGRWVWRLSLLGGAGATLSSLANIVEDGLRHDWAFFAFILGSAIGVFSLLALTAVIAFTERGRRRLLAVVPAAVVTGYILYVAAGGIIMLAAWLGAAAMEFVLPARVSAPAVAATP